MYLYIGFSPKFCFSKYDSLIIGKGASFPAGFTGISVFTATSFLKLTSKSSFVHVTFLCFDLHFGHLAIPFPDAQWQ